MNDKIMQIESAITEIKQENLRLINSIHEMLLEHERQIDAILNDFILVLDAYDKAENRIKSFEFADAENITKIIKRMLLPKKIVLSLLSKYNVRRIEFEDETVDENLCTIIDTEPDPERENGALISIEKNGYMRGDHLIRRAEVIVVRN